MALRSGYVSQSQGTSRRGKAWQGKVRCGEHVGERPERITYRLLSMDERS